MGKKEGASRSSTIKTYRLIYRSEKNIPKQEHGEIHRVVAAYSDFISSAAVFHCLNWEIIQYYYY